MCHFDFYSLLFTVQTVFLFIPNYVYSSDLLRTRFIAALAERLRVIVFLPVAPDPYPQHPNVTYLPWRLQFPDFWTFWGKTVRVPLIRMFDHEPLVQRNYQLSFGHWKRKALRRAAFFFPKYFWTPDFISRLEGRFLPRSKLFERHLRQYRPHLIITPTPGFTEIDAEAITLASRAGIPTAAIDFSWDNLTSNCKHLRKTDFLVCWTERMREQAIRIHHFPPAHVFVSGVVRFDHYFARQPGEQSREAFLRSKGLNPQERTILLTTVTKGNYRDEPKVLGALIRARAQGRFPGFPNLFVRLHPKEDNFDEYREFVRQPGVRVERGGKEREKNLGSRIELDQDDLVNLKDTLRHADVVINYASTITIEACAFDRPIVNIGYPPYFMNAYSFTHYRPVVELGAVRVARSEGELLEEVGANLADPARDRDARREAVRHFIGFTDGRSAERLAGAVTQISAIASRT